MMSISLLVAALLIPISLTSIADANLTGVSAIVSTVFTVLLPVLVILGLALAYMPPEIKGKLGSAFD